ncbi:MAG: helix-turn-helix domain-containing protein [Muribaculaceae bacterium]|nr:helix-turn-helix domain-containing protein [Muribaculaceae bacterium]
MDNQEATGKLDYGYMQLPMNVDEILKRDFWIFDNFTAAMLPVFKDPVKLSATISIFVRRGKFKVVVNLIPYDCEGPAIVNIRNGETMQVLECTPDIRASFIVMSKYFAEDIFLHINDMQNLTAMTRRPVHVVPEDLLPKFDALYESLHHVSEDTANPLAIKALRHAVIAFYYRYAYRMFDLAEAPGDSASRLSDRFIKLVKERFRTERFLEFYAEQLGVTPKHLSRTVKSQTGYTAASWIERFLILEAKILLKSTNLTVQQISDSLNFPTQSFFGKYFKKNVGISPKIYRNT